MKLKKLNIIGFKSFADKISIEFDCDITAIVGPNGCGKSNIVDAFRWVLGEQSAKSMRADKMPDVLFAGNDKRKPINYAEVTVELTDISKEFSPYHEISITRRLYITGESEYLINKQPSRLKDIQDLFMGSGLGKNAFSIFEQGKLDQVIHLRPEERRLIFDEAAGIGRFLARKKETLSKLSQVSENYNRLKDVFHEIEKETKVLKKQAEKAIGFKENKEKLFSLQKKVLLTKWKKSSEQEKILETKREKFQKDLKAKIEKQAHLEKELQILKEAHISQEKAFHLKQKELFETKTEIEILKKEKEEIKNRLYEASKKENAFQEEIYTLESSQKEELQKIEKEKAALIDLEKEKNRLEKLHELEKGKKEALEKQIENLRSKIQECQKKELALHREEKALDSHIQENRLKMAAKKERFEATLRQMQDKESKISDIEKEIHELTKKTKELSSEIDALKKKLKEAESALKDHYSQVDEKKEERAGLTQKITETTARKEILLKLKEQYEGFSSGAKKLLMEAKNPKSPFYKKIKPLLEEIPTKKALSAGIGAVLQFYSDTLVVPDQKTLKSVLSFAKKNSLNSFSLFSLDLLKEEREEKFLKHFLRHIQFVEKLEADFTPNVATHEGEFIDHNLVLFKRKGEDIFQREMEIQELSLLEEKLNKTLSQLDLTLDKLLKEAKEKEARRKECVEFHRKKEIALFRENFSLQKAEQNFGDEKKEKSLLEKESEKTRESQEELSLSNELLQKKKHLQKNLTLIAAEIQKEEKSLRELEERLNLKKTGEAQNQYLSALQKWQKRSHEIQLKTYQNEQIEKAIQKCKKELLELSQKKDLLHDTLQIKEASAAQKEKIWERLSTDFLETQEKLNTFLKKIDLSEKKYREESHLLISLEKEQYKLELHTEEILEKKKSFEESLKSQFQLSDEEKNNFSILEGDDLAAMESESLKLKIELEKEDRINLAAIEEFKEKEARFQFYEKQLLDLEESRKDLEKIITKLDGDSRKIFKKTFSEIRTNFQKNFAILFKGGEADLKFTDSTDVLEAGIEILAKPPGKNMKALSLLSGGEKCLTALSLLFAIFETRPAPFCILDEVDAPLDETNVGLFHTMLKQFTSKTQFLIVTHNKKTMAFADLLLGVSMEEKGVSKLISLTFEKKPVSLQLENSVI